MIRVLHIAVGSGAFGGAARFAINYYQHIDRDKIVFDFLFCNKNSLGLMENDPLLFESKIYELKILKDDYGIISYFRLIKAIRNIIKKGNYRIVHIDTGALPVQICSLFAAKLENVRVRIAHSHSAGDNDSKHRFKRIIKNNMKPLMQKIICYFATDYFACSLAAGENLFGKKGLHSEKFRLVHNAIDTRKFRYDENLRKCVRSEHHVTPETNIFGHVGRFDKVKNHLFLIDVFNEICNLNANSQLWIIGDGPEAENIKDKIKQSPFKDNIVLFGERNDVHILMQGLDLFFLPSFYEGLSIVAIEAQCSGLPVFASITISQEHNVSGNVRFLDIKDSPQKWAKEVLRFINKYQRVDTMDVMTNGGYEIETEAKKLELFYINAIGK